MVLHQSRILVLTVLLWCNLPCSLLAADNPGHSTDTTTLRHKLIKFGSFHAHFRSFVMASDNQFPLSDHAAWALGAGIGYESPKWKGFQFGVSGFFIFNALSTDLAARDSLTNAPNRYEIGLFDVNNPKNKSDLDRLEKLFIRYTFRKSNIEVGRIYLNTPFINPQDGRMRGTYEEGVWFKMQEIEKLKLEGGWLWRISPRSTVEWYSIGESIGIYPVGVNQSGVKSSYIGNIHSKGIGIMNVDYTPVKNLTFSVWEQFTHNVFNTLLVQVDIKQALNNKVSLIGGTMYVRQDAIHCGGNCNQELTYTPKNAKSNSISTRIGINAKAFEATINYTHITDQGRFIMPREWGREPFYTFMARERIEGSGSVNSLNMKLSYRFCKGSLLTAISYGHFYMPDVKDFALNKYGIPSYRQLNADVKYKFKGYLDGFSISVLMVYKGRIGESYNEYKYLYNKVNMMNWNFIIDYIF